MGRTKSTIAPVKPKKCVRKKYGVYDKQLLFNVIEKYKPTGVLLWQQVAEEYRERRGDVHTRPPQVIETYFYTHLCKTMGKNAWTNDKDQFTKDCRSLFDRIAKYHGARNIGSSDSEEESNSEEGADSEGDSGDSEDECDGWGADVWDEEFDDFDEEFGDWDEEESSDQNEECGGREEEEDFDEEESIDSDESMDEDNPEAIKKGSPDDIRRRILRNCDEVRRNLEKEYGKLDSKSNARTSQTVRPDRESSENRSEVDKLKTTTKVTVPVPKQQKDKEEPWDKNKILNELRKLQVNYKVEMDRIMRESRRLQRELLIRMNKQLVS